MDETQHYAMMMVKRPRTPQSMVLVEKNRPLFRHMNYHHSAFYQYDSPPASENHTEGLLLQLLRLIQSACFVLFLGFLSIVTYHVLYIVFIVPSPNIVQDLYFDYSQRADTLQSDRHASTPTAIANLFEATPSLGGTDEFAFTFGQPPISPSPYSKPLKPKQAYSIDIQLLLPDSPMNRFSSMFTVQTELYATAVRTNITTPMECRDVKLDADPGFIDSKETNSSEALTNVGNQSSHCAVDLDATSENDTIPTVDHPPHEWVLLGQSRRSYRFPYHSAWITTLYNMIHIVPILWNYYHFDASVTSWESHQIFGTSFPHYVEMPSIPLQRIVVKLLEPTIPAASNGLSSHAIGCVEIVHGKLLIREVYTVLQQIVIRDWYYTCAWIGSMLICWFYYGLYYVTFRKLSPVLPQPRNDQHRDPELFSDDFDSFDYYNDIHLDDTASNIVPNDGECNPQRDTGMYPCQDDEFFDAIMFPLNSESSSSNSPPAFPENVSKHPLVNDFGFPPTTWVKICHEYVGHEDIWEDLTVVDMPIDGALPVVNVHPFTDKEQPSDPSFSLSHHEPMSSRPFELLQNGHTLSVTKSYDSPNVETRHVQRTNSYVTTSPTRVREISGTELEEIWMHSMDQKRNDVTVSSSFGNDECANDASSNYNRDDQHKERHPFFIFLSW